jgi:hypothetical protein
MCGIGVGIETTFSSSSTVESFYSRVGNKSNSTTNLKVASTTWPILVGQNVFEATPIKHIACWR